MDMSRKPQKPFQGAAYKVGYGKPPKATQFGQRPQPQRGRELAKTSAIDVAALLDGPARVERGGKIVSMHPHEIKMRSLRKRALRRQTRAIWSFLKECKKAGLLEPPPQVRRSTTVAIPRHMPKAVFDVLMSTGLPPWHPKLRAQVEVDYERDCTIIANMCKQHQDNFDE